MIKERRRREKIDTEAWPEVLYVATQIRAARENAGLSQLEAAALTGVGQSYLSSVESCYNNPSIQFLAQLSRTYKVPLITFMPEITFDKQPNAPRRKPDATVQEVEEKGAKSPSRPKLDTTGNGDRPSAEE
ncbi:MAG: helix-turn-helix domain-containing protein [Brevundimonas sp.]